MFRITPFYHRIKSLIKIGCETPPLHFGIRPQQKSKDLYTKGHSIITFARGEKSPSKCECMRTGWRGEGVHVDINVCL